MENKLKLLDLGKKYNIIELESIEGFSEYEISLKNNYEDEEEYSYSLICVLKFNDKSKLIEENYYLTDIYNSGTHYGLINMYELNKLKEFVKLLIEEE